MVVIFPCLTFIIEKEKKQKLLKGIGVKYPTASMFCRVLF